MREFQSLQTEVHWTRVLMSSLGRISDAITSKGRSGIEFECDMIDLGILMSDEKKY